ncbi:cupin domain-containing protein [uncultured Halopseudomonas sp.]|uniref:cupin domain-containing protein n=1 Tax=uncultured Halopseudomonas sp. TaxID=2901193 RepID=UPI0030ED16F2|tara:strand:+ start:6477 stop:7163 length:687 start_codon:yes stop_codon:yes gene_type:complete
MKTDTSSPPNFVPLNMDRRLRVCIRPGDQHWQSAPQAPIRRWPLEREAPESGQVTSLVEYLPEARFPQHTHPNGEEIYVLEGVFSDETGDYPAGSYLRSPAGSRHSPFSEEGCLIFVKLNQFAQKDAAQVRLRPSEQSWGKRAAGAVVSVLHSFTAEETLLYSCSAGQALDLPAGPGELLVLSGSLQSAEGDMPALTWLRHPDLADHGLASRAGAVLLVKSRAPAEPA